MRIFPTSMESTELHGYKTCTLLTAITYVAIFGDLRRMYLLNSNHIKFRMVDLLACYLHQMLYYYEKTKLACDFLWTTIIFGARKYCVILKRFLSCAA